MKYLFGPVRSRRLGLSLGVDLLPFKTCSMNCVYCECGPTTSHTAEIMEYFPTHDVIAELDLYLGKNPDLDVITFAGSGEPTLHSGLGDIIDFIKVKYPRYRVAVLTNGSLLWLEEVRRALLRADIISPSLDAVSPEIFGKINRPSTGLDPAKIIGGMIQLRAEFRGEIHLEVFIVQGVNDLPGELDLIREAALRIKPDRLQLNTLDRPGTDPSLEPADRDTMERIRDFMKPLPVEIIGAPVAGKRDAARGNADAILATLRRRPSTAVDLAASLGLEAGEAEALLERMADGGTVEKRTGDRGIFYSAK